MQAAAQAGGSMFTPVSLAFLDLNYAVTTGRGKAKKEKTIIDNVSGYVRQGSFVAIMGPSGRELKYRRYHKYRTPLINVPSPSRCHQGCLCIIILYYWFVNAGCKISELSIAG